MPREWSPRCQSCGTRSGSRLSGKAFSGHHRRLLRAQPEDDCSLAAYPFENSLLGTGYKVGFVGLAVPESPSEGLGLGLEWPRFISKRFTLSVTLSKTQCFLICATGRLRLSF